MHDRFLQKWNLWGLGIPNQVHATWETLGKSKYSAFFSKIWLNFRKFLISSKCPHKYFIRSGIYNFCPEMIAFVVKINSRLILGVFAKMAEFLGSSKTFSMHIHVYDIRCRIGDFCLEMKSVFDKNELFVFFGSFFFQKWLDLKQSGDLCQGI